MSLQAIKDAIPHRSPMLLVDEIVEQTDDTIHCRKQFSADEFFVQGHFPDFPLVPGVILCECAMQAGAILLASKASDPEKSVPVATRIDGVKFKNMVRPGDSIDIHVTLDESVSGAFFLSAKILNDGSNAARLKFACTLTNPSA